ncbi:MAG: transglutaminase domain-containing protein, partial [Phycisphaerae bacterium]
MNRRQSMSRRSTRTAGRLSRSVFLHGVLVCLWGHVPGVAEAARKPIDFGHLPNGASYAFVPDNRPGLPTITQPGGMRLTPVLVRPLIPGRFPEELVDEAVFRSPDPDPAGIAWGGSSLWLAGRKSKRIFRIDPGSGKVLESFPAPGRFPTCLAFDGRRLWHTDARTRRLYCLVEGKVTRQFALDWECVGVTAAGDGLIVGDWQSDKLRVVSKQTGKVVRTIDAPDKNLWGLATDGEHLWCARGDCLIVQDQQRCLPIGGFGVAGRRPDARRVSGLDIAGDWIWYADNLKGRVVKLRKPSGGQQVAAKGVEREATFWMKVQNKSRRNWQPFSFLMNVPIYEMPGQRFLSYRIQPPPMAHYRDPDGNLHALYRRERFGPSDTLRVEVRARLWSADRWTFLDPRRVHGRIPESLQRICSEGFKDQLPLKDPFIRDFALAAAKGESNPYWKLRRVHDALIDRVTYAQPPDESVAGPLRTGKGLCRNFSTVLQALGRIVDVPVLDAWAPHHNLVCAHLPGTGWAFIEVTANNSKESMNRWRRSIWFGGLPGGQLTTGVRGPSILDEATIDGQPFVNKWHCRIPKGLAGFSHQA